jgi:hypothetical protein
MRMKKDKFAFFLVAACQLPWKQGIANSKLET